MGFFYYFGIASFAFLIGWALFKLLTPKGQDVEAGTADDLVVFLKQLSGWYRLVLVPEKGRVVAILYKRNDRYFFHLNDTGDQLIVDDENNTPYDTIIKQGGKVFKQDAFGDVREVKMNKDEVIRSK